jgi:hypothetical protein
MAITEVGMLRRADASHWLGDKEMRERGVEDVVKAAQTKSDRSVFHRVLTKGTHRPYPRGSATLATFSLH